MASTVLFRLGLKQIKRGGPLLSLLEAAAMSDTRNSKDIFDLLNSVSLDFSQGEAVDRIARDEGTKRLPARAGTGKVTVTDSRFTKLQTRLYAGKPAPLTGSATLFVADASLAPSAGSVFVGRGTTSAEGPLAYTAKTDMGGFWKLDLAGGSHTQAFHRLGESVTFAQGGNRVISAGTIVQAPASGTASAVQFTTIYSTTILDGEVEADGIDVQAKQTGSASNAPRGTLSEFSSPPFSGAVVTNPTPVSNGRDVETDDELKDRIRALRSSRALGTATALTANVIGIESPDEHKRVASAAVSRSANRASTLYVDDGTGYEEIDEGTPVETLVDDASGGERAFRLDQRPVQEAALTTTLTAPFALSAGQTLAFLIGGDLSEHTFAATEFRTIGAASAYEVASAINGDPALTFSARTAGGGQAVVVFARTDDTVEVEVVAPEGLDANLALGFPAGAAQPLRLFKNDRLLSQSGVEASLTGNAANDWGSITGSPTLWLAVDNTPDLFATFTDADFSAANTGFSSVGNNTPEAWAAVINAALPGITATVVSDAVRISSNLGRDNRAKIAVKGGDLVSAGVLPLGVSVGVTSDYSLDRHRGEIYLAEPLASGDTLSAGSPALQPFVETPALDPVTLGTTAHVYLAVDGLAQIIPTGINSAQLFNITVPLTGAWGARYRVASVAFAPFIAAAVGDWLVVWDSASAWNTFRTALRICAVDPAGTWIEVEFDNPGGVAASNVAFVDGGVAVVRYAGQLQDVQIPAGTNYTPDALAALILPIGASAATFQTTHLRLSTNTAGTAGDIAVVAVNTNSDALDLELPVGSAVPSAIGTVAGVIAGNPEAGTPTFEELSAASSASTTEVSITDAAGVAPDRVVVGRRNSLIVAANDRFGNNRSFKTQIDHVVPGSPNQVFTRRAVLKLWQPQDRLMLAAPYALTPEDDLTVLVDGDVDAGRFSIPMWRALKPTTGTYGTTNAFKDIGDGTATPASLAVAFGLTFDWSDFAVYMRAREKSHPADGTKSALWRYYRYGSEGNFAGVGYTYPSTPSAAVSVSMSNALNPAQISIGLPSGAARTGYTVRNTTALGLGFNSGAGPLGAVTIAVGFAISTASRTSNVTTATLTLPSGSYAVTDHGLAVGMLVWVQSTSGSFTTGLKAITARSATTISYAETAADVGATATPGTVSMDTAGEAKFSGASIVVGDLVHVGNIPGTFTGSSTVGHTLRIAALGAQFVQGVPEIDGVGSTSTLVWTHSGAMNVLGSTANIAFYPLSGNTVNAVVAAVNAISASPVAGTVLGTGAGAVTLSTRDELLTSPALYQLQDGVNWVRSNTSPPDTATDYSITFKAGIDGGLVSGSDWANEVVRIVPITAKGVSDWLSALGVSGLSDMATILPAMRGQRPQIVSRTLGSAGSVQVEGGTANAASSAIVGAGTTDGTFGRGTFSAADMGGFRGGQFVELVNASPLTKSANIDATAALASWTAGGVLTLSAGPGFYTSQQLNRAFTGSIEPQGQFARLATPLAGTTFEGDWVTIAPPNDASVPAVSSANCGTFRVVRYDAVSGDIWYDNPAATAEANVRLGAIVVTSTSVIPGDKLVVASSAWGDGNQGTWTVAFVGAAAPFDNTLVIRVDTSERAVVPQGAVAALGVTEAQKVLFVQGTPTRLIKRIQLISPNPTNSAWADVRFDTHRATTDASAGAGTIMRTLDKLAFPSAAAAGQDGYRHAVGLIGEANRVIYGDPDDPTTYPGVVAEGAQVGLSGSLVRRIQLALVVRTQSNVPRADVEEQVRSVAAATVNRSGTSESIALSAIVGACESVHGVKSVAVQSPQYDPAHDLIVVGQGEKALVISPDDDISVSFLDT